MTEAANQEPQFPVYQPPSGIPLDTNNLKRPLTKLITKMWNPKKLSRSALKITHKRPKKKAHFL